MSAQRLPYAWWPCGAGMPLVCLWVRASGHTGPLSFLQDECRPTAAWVITHLDEDRVRLHAEGNLLHVRGELVVPGAGTAPAQ